MPKSGAKALPASEGEAGSETVPDTEVEEGTNTESEEPSSPRRDASTDPFEQSGQRMTAGRVLTTLS